MSTIESYLDELTNETDKKIARFTNDQVRVVIGDLERTGLSEVQVHWAETDDRVCSVGMTLSDEPMIKMLIALSPATRRQLAACLVGEQGAENRELADSVLQEIGNIFGTAIANVLAAQWEIPVRTSTPEVTEDMAGALIGSVLASMPMIGDSVLQMRAHFRIKGEETACQIHLFFDEESAPALPSDPVASLEQQGKE